MRAEMAVAPQAPALIAPRAARAQTAQVETAALARMLWRRRRGIALCGAAAFALALVYCLLATPQYAATAEILVDPRDKQVVANDVNPSSIAADGGVTQVESQGDVLLSDAVLRRAVEATHLTEDSEFNGSGLLHALAGFLRRSRDSADDTLSRTLLTLRKQAHYNRADKALVLDLKVSARTPEKAALLANAIAKAYLDDQRDARARSGREASGQLESRLAELQADVERKEAAVEDYRAQHNFVVSSGQLVSDQEINQATAQLSAAQNRVASLKSQLDQLRRNAGAQGTPEAMSSAVLAKLRDREGGLVEKLASANRLLGPRHPDIASLQQSLAEVRGLITAEISRLREAAQADYARAVADEKALTVKLDAMKVKSLDDGKADVNLRELQRKAEAAKAIYQSFMLRARETMEASNVDTSNARVITPALAPLQKSWPPTIPLLIGAAFMGLSFGVGGALAREYLKPNLYTPGQLRDALDAPVLGVTSLADLVAKRPSAPAAAALAALTRHDAKSETGSPVGHCAFLVSAPSGAQARTQFARAFATLAAREGFETLWIDADLSDDAASERPGLRELLRGDLSAADLAYREEGEAFSRLAKGALESGAFRRRDGNDAFRLRRLRRAYDLVIVEAGPLSQNARLASLAAQADLNLLVAVTGDSLDALVAEAEVAATASAPIDASALVEVDLG